MEYLIGAILGFILALFAKLANCEKRRWFYPLLLVVIAFIYVLFGILDGRPQVIFFEIIFAVGFSLIAYIGWKKGLLITAISILAHGIFDISHHLIFENEGVPSFYPQFCLAVDVVLGIYLLAIHFLYSKKIKTL